MSFVAQHSCSVVPIGSLQFDKLPSNPASLNRLGEISSFRLFMPCHLSTIDTGTSTEPHFVDGEVVIPR